MFSKYFVNESLLPNDGVCFIDFCCSCYYYYYYCCCCCCCCYCVRCNYHIANRQKKRKERKRIRQMQRKLFIYLPLFLAYFSICSTIVAAAAVAAWIYSDLYSLNANAFRVNYLHLHTLKHAHIYSHIHTNIKRQKLLQRWPRPGICSYEYVCI